MLDASLKEPPVSRQQPMLEPDDRQLLLRCSSGDTAAFEVLYLRFQPRLYRFLFRMLGNHELTEEAVADTLYAVWKSAASFEGRAAVSSWIFAISYKTALKALGRDTRHTDHRDSADAIDTLEDGNPSHDPMRMTSANLDSRRLSVAFSKLSAEHQAVVELTATGHSCEEIAIIVDCPRNTVKTRMFHARKHLQRLLSHTL